VCVGSGTSGGANRARRPPGEAAWDLGFILGMRARGSLAACGGYTKEGSAGCARRFRARRALREGRAVAAEAEAQIAGAMPSAPAAELKGN
jgi:hypothetical protein